MPNPYIPGFVQANGAFRGYTKGHTAMKANVMHFTVGRYQGDYSIGMQGYFPAYAPREMQPVQFAEIDALTWHAGSWNGDGPGIEFERLSWDEPLTQRQVDVGGGYIAFLHDEWGIPLDFYDGPRVDKWNGFINHGSLLGRNGERQDHTDGITRDEWTAMTTGDDMTKEEHDALFEVLEWIKGGAYIPPAKSIAGRVAEIDGILSGGDNHQFPPMEERIVKAIPCSGGSTANPTSFKVTLTGDAKPA